MNLKTQITIPILSLLVMALILSSWKNISICRETLQEYHLSETLEQAKPLFDELHTVFSSPKQQELYEQQSVSGQQASPGLSISEWSCLQYKFKQLLCEHGKTEEYVLQINGTSIYNNSGINVQEALLRANPNAAIPDMAGKNPGSELYGLDDTSPTLSCILSLSGNDYCIAGKIFQLEGQIYTAAYVNDITKPMNLVWQMTVRYIQIGVTVTLLTAVLVISILSRTLHPIQILQKKAAEISKGNYQARIPLPEKSQARPKKPQAKPGKSQAKPGKSQARPKKSQTKPGKLRQKAENACQANELAALSISFNKMAEAVELHIREVETQSEQRKMLISALSHEMRTPVTSITGYCYLLLHSKLTEEQQQEALCFIDSECKRLERLSGKLAQLVSLDYSEHSLEEISAAELGKAVKHTLAPSAQKYGITLQIQAEPNISFKGDPDLFIMLITNLFDNARKANAKIVTILLEEGCISIKDNGNGIPEDKLDKVGQPFYQGDESRNTEGFGLGLALCQKIAAIHGAALEIKSEYGTGTAISYRQL